MTRNPIPRLTLAIVQDHAIFLDCAADRYFAVSPVENDALLALLDGKTICVRVKRALSAVIGMEADGATLRSMLPVLAPGVRVRVPAPAMPPGWSDRLGAVRHLAAATAVLKLRGLHGALEGLARISAHASRDAPAFALEDLDRVVGGHDWLSRHFTQNDACLLRSLALARHARASGLQAWLVIGVRVDPFTAHCWVECEDGILNEDPDAVATFQPILVVR